MTTITPSLVEYRVSSNARGLIVFHKTALYDDTIRADQYRNDPYVWFDPFLWSFCHLAQRPRIEIGMPVLFLSKVDGVYVCDLVFVVGEILSLQEARDRYEHLDQELARDHFQKGVDNHQQYAASDDAKTYVTDMSRSYIPHPAVPVEEEVDAIRKRESNGQARPLYVAWRRPSAPLRIEDMDQLERFVFQGASRHLKGALGSTNRSLGLTCLGDCK
jgi:hypothetical protein